MVDVKPEVLVPEIADGMYVKFQWNQHCWGSNNMAGRMLVQSDVRVSDKSNMAVRNRTGI